MLFEARLAIDGLGRDGIVEGVGLVADDLAGLMAFAGDQKRIAGFQQRDGKSGQSRTQCFDTFRPRRGRVLGHGTLHSRFGK